MKDPIKCETCTHYEERGESEDKDWGWCRLRAPKTITIDRQATTVWPVVWGKTDWCGQWVADQ